MLRSFLNILVLILCISIFGYVKADDSSTKTHGDGKISKTTIQTINLPRIVRSSITKPENIDFSLLSQQNQIDNKGTEFWVCFQQNYDNIEHPLSLKFFVTSDFNTNVTVQIPGISWQQQYSVIANEITTVYIPSPLNVVVSGEGRFNKGIHILSDEEVTVYGLNQMQYTTDAYLALPLDILNVFYLVMSYTSISNDKNQSQFAIVSPYDNVTVTITPACNTEGGRYANQPFSITLNKGDVYQVQAYNYNDLTGSIIQSTLPVAVFGGHSCANIPTNFGYCDHLVEQLPPLNTWGSSFVTIPLRGRENGDTFRILASQDGTNLNINGQFIGTLNFGDFYETVLKYPVYIDASNPILVMQYSNGNEYDPNISNNGDPFMMLIPPTEQFMTHYTFSTPSSGFPTNYVSITISSAGISSLVLDGNPIESNKFTRISNTDYYGAGIPVGIGSHSINNTNGVPFGIYSYGFWDDDSYGYAGGLSLEYIYEGSAPEIVLTPETVALSETAQIAYLPLTIAATITDAEEPFTQSAALFYRKLNTPNYTRILMTKGNNDVWTAQIPAADVQDPGIFYYLYATDGQLSSTSPKINASYNPYSIAVLPNQPPSIIHTPVTSAPPNVDLQILATITDNTQWLASAKLFYRVPGGNPVYAEVDMNSIGNNEYKGTIPNYVVTEQNLEYYIKATDNYGVSSYHGTADNPHFVTVAVLVPMSFIVVDSTSDLKPIANKTEFLVYLYDSQNNQIEEIQNISTNENGILKNLASQQWDKAEYIKVEKIVHVEKSVKPNHLAVNNTMFIVYLDTDTLDSEGNIHHIQINKTLSEQSVIMSHTTIAYNLIVSVEWDADQSYLENLLQGFRYMSNYLYDVTDGQQYINKVAIYDTAKHWNSADIRILCNNVSGAYNNNGVYGAKSNNIHIHMPRIYYSNVPDRNRNLSYDINYYPYNWCRIITTYRERNREYTQYGVTYKGLSHEFGHYGFGFFDEYAGVNYNPRQIYSGYNFGLMDGWEKYANPTNVDEMTTEMSSILNYDAGHQQTWQFQARNGSCWDWFEQEFEKTSGGIYYPILKPNEHPANQTINGPNNDIENPQHDVGSILLRNSNNLIFNPSNTAFMVDVLVRDGLRIPISNSRITLYKDNRRIVIEQGRTANNGRIRVLGAHNGDIVRCYARIDWDWFYSEFIVGSSGVSLYKNYFETSATQDSGVVILRPVVGNIKMVNEINFQTQNNIEYLISFAKPLPEIPSLELYIDSQAPTILPFNSTPEPSRYKISISDLNKSGLINILAKDDSLNSFFINQNFIIRDSLDRYFMPIHYNFDGSCEMSLDTTNSSIKKLLMLSSDFNPILNGLEINVEQGGSMHTVASFPDETELSGINVLTIRYSDSDLQSKLESTLRIFKWDLSSRQWQRIGGEVDTMLNEVTAEINSLGTYAAFTTKAGSTDEKLDNNNCYFYPNPFNPDKVIGHFVFGLEKAGNITIKIYDVANSKVVIIEAGSYNSGSGYEVAWDGKNLNGQIVANGVYFYIIESSSGERAVGKVAVLR